MASPITVLRQTRRVPTRVSLRMSLPTDEFGQRAKRRSKRMLDVILLAAGLGFFVASIAYAYGCERL
jgi:hypothetical protein